jgi:hypothetical protein
MKLPAEIRLEILRELLWQPEPLKTIRRLSRGAAVSHVETTNYAFHPAILETCRKLNEEGCTVLYEENTVDVILACYPLTYGGNRMDWMGYAIDLERAPKSLIQRARKLRITVHVDRSSYMLASLGQSDLRVLVKILQANPPWCREILRPFGILRRLRYVDVTGVSPQLVAELRELMKSDSPVTDLPKMSYLLTGTHKLVSLEPAETSIPTSSAPG